MKSKDMKDSSNNVFLYGITPLKLTVNEQEIWKNPTPNSAETLRPIYLVREKETDPVLIETVIESTDLVRNDLNSNGLDLTIDGSVVHINLYIQDTMKDLKLKRAISGCSGAPCILCKSQG